VFPPFTVSIPSPIKVAPCSQTQVPVEVTWANRAFTPTTTFTGDVTLSAQGVPGDDQASFNPATVSFNPATYTATTTLTLLGSAKGLTHKVQLDPSGGL